MQGEGYKRCRWTPLMLSCAILAGWLCVLAAAAREEAQSMVERTTNEVLTILKENRKRIVNEPGFLEQEIRRVIVPHLDLESMTKLAVAVYWRKADSGQRARLVDEFRTLLLRTYAKSLAKFSDQQVEFLPFSDSGRVDRAVVRSRIIQSADRPPINLEFRLRLLDTGWKIYDISVDNISLVISYRASFDSQIRQTGLDGLIASLAEKNTKPTP